MIDLKRYAGRVPSETIEALCVYAVAHITPGKFIEAVLANDLIDSLSLANDRDREALFVTACMVWNELPEACHGSREKVAAWLRPTQLEKGA